MTMEVKTRILFFTSLLAYIFASFQFLYSPEIARTIQKEVSLDTISGANTYQDAESARPEICWLMSYPNSGTSFTMKLVGRLTNATVASNYGQECIDFDKNGQEQRENMYENPSHERKPIPLFNESPNGPFLLNPERTLPRSYILTKTHCGGRCNECGSKGFLETPNSFLEACATGSLGTDPKTGTKKRISYDPSFVKKAIHIARDPFDNIVSNFHLEYHEKKKESNQHWLQTYSNDRNGFRKWCMSLNAKYPFDFIEYNATFSPYIMQTLQDIPCYKLFFQIIQWHNLASHVTKELHLPSLLLHYEDYENDFNKTIEKISTFIDISQGKGGAYFTPGKRYKHYFRANEIKKVKGFVLELSTETTWKILQRYF